MITPFLMAPNCCTIKTANATAHNKAPKPVINVLLPITFDFLNAIKFTTAKINKKPALPEVERVSKLIKFAIPKVKMMVSNKPIGLFHN